MNFIEKIEKNRRDQKLPEKTARILIQLQQSYLRVVHAQKKPVEKAENLFCRFLDLVLQQIESPYSFGLYHQKLTSPFNYYEFGLQMMRPLLVKEESAVYGLENLETIRKLIAANENVILFANHQTEPDPQIINLLLEDDYRQLASEMIFVAGDRVITDPLAVPLSLGCNLLCIYSKKHIHTPPEKKEEKLLHNQRTMKKMLELLSDGGKCIYIAPSGGRDRLGEDGKPKVAPFEPNNIEMIYLISRQAQKKTHFFPLSLYTYPLMPPPEQVEEEIGELRTPSASPAYLHFGNEIDMEAIPQEQTKEDLRKARAEKIYQIVRKNYEKIRR